MSYIIFTSPACAENVMMTLMHYLNIYETIIHLILLVYLLKYHICLKDYDFSSPCRFIKDKTCLEFGIISISA